MGSLVWGRRGRGQKKRKVVLAAGGKCRIASHAIGDVSHVVTAGQTQTMELCVWDLLESTKPFVGPFYGFRTYSLHNEIF